MTPILNLGRVNEQEPLDKQVKQLQSQIYQLKEQFELILEGINNQNEKSIKAVKTNLEEVINENELVNEQFKSYTKQTAEEISGRVETTEGDVAELKLLPGTMVLKAYQDKDGKQKIAMIRLDGTGEQSEIILSAESITLEGLITANENFQIDENGNMIIKSSNYTVKGNAIEEEMGALQITRNKDGRGLAIGSAINAIWPEDGEQQARTVFNIGTNGTTPEPIIVSIGNRMCALMIISNTDIDAVINGRWTKLATQDWVEENYQKNEGGR